MTSAIRHEGWLLFPLVMLAGNLAAEAPQARQAPVQPEVKVPTLLTAKPVKEDPKDDDLRKLLKARYNEAVAEMEARYKEFLSGRERGTFDAMVEVAQRLVQSGLELNDKPAERAALLAQYVELTKEVEKIAQARFDVARIPVDELHRARYQRLDAEIQLLRAKREVDKAKGK